jgi:DNA adenine methylase
MVISPLKAQGVKSKLSPWINSILPSANSLIEPFCCTGVISLNTSYPNYWLNDINPYVINFYKGVLSGDINKESVRKFLEYEGKNLNEDGDTYYKFIRERFNKTHDPFDFLFLSRSCFNGMIRFNKKGEYNTPFCKKPNRFSKSYITKIVNQVDKVSSIINSNWKFTNIDFRYVIKSATKDDVLYLDPPYLGRHVEYFVGWSEQDEIDMYDLLAKTPAKFVLSTWHHNDYRSNESSKYWKDYDIQTADHFYHLGGKIANRKTVVEALIYRI